MQSEQRRQKFVKLQLFDLVQLLKAIHFPSVSKYLEPQTRPAGRESKHGGRRAPRNNRGASCRSQI